MSNAIPLFPQHHKIGDLVQLDTGEEGTVDGIILMRRNNIYTVVDCNGWRYTVSRADIANNITQGKLS